MSTPVPTSLFHHAQRNVRTVAVMLMAFTLSACANGGLGGIFGGDERPIESQPVAGEISGTVEQVDAVDRQIIIEADRQDLRATLRNSGDRVVLNYDDRTTVEYRGQTYDPADLERGDRIQARVDDSQGRLWVRQIDVLYDVTGDDRVADRGYESTIRGTVDYIDERRGLMEIRRAGSREPLDVYYDTDTTVEYQGQRYRAENLEAGDEIEVEIRDTGSRLWAEQVLVLRSAGDVALNETFNPDMRGTVRYVDTDARVIELERVEPLLSSFDTRRNERVLLRYDAETRVEFDGRLYSPENLEPGDVISVDTRSIEGDLLAEHILVVADVNGRTSLVD